MKPELRLVDGLTLSDSGDLSHRKIYVQFDCDDIAAAIGVSTDALIERMLQTLSRALAVDAAALADEEMRAHGQRFGVDGLPVGWPNEYLAAVCVCRLFPELDK